MEEIKKDWEKRFIRGDYVSNKALGWRGGEPIFDFITEVYLKAKEAGKKDLLEEILEDLHQADISGDQQMTIERLLSKYKRIQSKNIEEK
jgi:hypothetical protein